MTRSRFGLLGLLVGVLVGARARRRDRAGDPRADHVELLLVERDARRASHQLRRDLDRVERHARRRTALTVALVAIAVLPALAFAVRPDADPVAAAVAVGAYALLAVGALVAAARLDRTARRDG